MTDATDVQAVPAPTQTARLVFGEQLPMAERFAAFLADAAVVRGAIGPREAPRLWERHLVSSALLTDLMEPDARVLDVGSGAGLPGLPMAIRRPDLRVDLLEPMQRRVDLLNDAIGLLDLGERVRVHRGRADEPAVRHHLGDAPWVTARALAPLDRLVTWCLPLVAPRGALAAVKGRSAVDEVYRFGPAVRRAGGAAPEIVVLGASGDRHVPDGREGDGVSDQSEDESSVRVVVVRRAHGSTRAVRRQ